MAVRLPVTSTYAERPVRVKLDGTFYWIRTAWNVKEAVWTLGISDTDDVPIAHGIAIRVGLDMLRGLRGQAGMPPGALVPIDTSGRGLDPGREDLGERVRIIYVTQEELPATSSTTYQQAVR